MLIQEEYDMKKFQLNDTNSPAANRDWLSENNTAIARDDATSMFEDNSTAVGFFDELSGDIKVLDNVDELSELSEDTSIYSINTSAGELSDA